MKHGDKYRSPHETGVHVQSVNMQKAVQCAAAKLAFDASQCMARWLTQYQPAAKVPLLQLLSDEEVLKPSVHRSYVIYTGTFYGKPLFVWDESSQLWFENSDWLYGKITTRQRKRMRPQCEVHKFDTLTMEAIVIWGFGYVAKARMDRKRDWQDELRSMIDRICATRDFRRDLAYQWRSRHVINYPK